MTKEEILSKSRTEKDDEGVKYCELQEIKLGFYWMSLVYGIVAMVNLLIAFLKGSEMLGFYVASSLYFCFLSSQAYTKYRFTAEKKWKIYVITNAMASVGFFANWFVRIMWP